MVNIYFILLYHKYFILPTKSFSAKKHIIGRQKSKSIQIGDRNVRKNRRWDRDKAVNKSGV